MPEGNSTAMGNSTIAEGVNTTAMGLETHARGENATAMGNGTKADAYSSLAKAPHNIGGGDPANWVETDPIFIIGNGSDWQNPSNALTVLKNGNMGLGTTTPGATLDVEGTLRYADGTEGENKVLTSDADGNATWQELVDEVNDADADPTNELQASPVLRPGYADPDPGERGHSGSDLFGQYT
ncbi:MAG: hypothetical protein IPJ06_12365 [Saprospiraceae bacterium]|nr:hypothetical protein [Saprospiraceae bacterium]